jgi:hypothetical protein
MTKSRVWLLVTLIAVLSAVACLGTLAADPRAERVALAPEAELGLPIRDSRRHWLLRGEPGWCGGHEVRYGGEPDDPAVIAVRSALFRDIDSAVAAYNQLTPTYLYNIQRGRIVDVPRPIEPLQPLAGDAVSVTLYDVRLPLVNGPDATLLGQFTTVRAGRVVLLLESIGVPWERLVPAVRELVRAANRLPSDEC